MGKHKEKSWSRQPPHLGDTAGQWKTQFAKYLYVPYPEAEAVCTLVALLFSDPKSSAQSPRLSAAD